MAFDVTLRAALRELVNGNGDLLAELVEAGGTKHLHETLEHYPEARAKLAKTILTGKPLKKRERPWERVRLDQRDLYLLGRVAYWIGRGFDDKWQDSKADSCSGAEGTVWHNAADEWTVQPRLKAQSLQKIWLRALREQNAMQRHVMTLNFCFGVEHELADVDDPDAFLSRQWLKAGSLKLEGLTYAPMLMALMGSAEDTK